MHPTVEVGGVAWDDVEDVGSHMRRVRTVRALIRIDDHDRHRSVTSTIEGMLATVMCGEVRPESLA